MVLMILFRGASIPNSWPAIFLKAHNTLVVADLHIGYESALRRKGRHLPQASYSYMKRALESMLTQTGAGSIVFLGDLKHEFGKPSPQEWVEVMDLLGWLTGAGVRVHVVRGNHDNLILAILSKFNVILHESHMVIGNILLTHGNAFVEPPEGTRTIIIAHEHPAVASSDFAGARYKFKCFLVGEFEGRRIVVMPALSPLSSGVGINETPTDGLLSPYLRRSAVDSFTPFVVEENVGIFRFPAIGIMRQSASQNRAPQ